MKRSLIDSNPLGVNNQGVVSNMREIGSEFWDVPICNEGNTLFGNNTSWFLSGRTALRGIIKEIKSKRELRTVSIPSWCCDSMILPFIDSGIEVGFYPVYYDGGIVQDSSAVDTDAVLVMDYFGYTGRNHFSGYEGIIIRDVTHSIFSAVYNDADYYFGSLRKWAGFWTGGYAWGIKPVEKTDKKYVLLRKAAMKAKKEYISGIFNNKDYLRIFNEAEEYLDSCGSVATAHSRDVELAYKLDIEAIRIQRKRNEKVLLEQLKDIAIFPIIRKTDCPMFFPIYVANGKRNELRNYLIERDIYCPVHWPVSKYHELTNQTKGIYENELSLVCDHRYTEDDMARIIKMIKEFWKGE